MKRLLRDVARLTTQQWITLISLLVMLNMVILVGIVWIIASDIVPEQVILEQVILAQAISTRTPYPTYTPGLPRGRLPTWTPKPTPTNTSVPTWTPSITPTPSPTNTPLPTDTPLPTSTSLPVQVRVVNTPTPSPTPTPDVDYIATIRQLTPCENQGKHHIFVHVVDLNGNGIPGKNVRISWPGGEGMLETGTKIEDPGLADFAMFKGTYYAEMVGAKSQIVGPISPNIPQNELCDENGNPEANSLFHYSFEVTFTKVR